MRALGLLILAAALMRGGDLVIVVNPASGVERLNREEVLNLFMGRSRKLPSGVAALPIDQAGTAPDRIRFYRALTGRELPEINAYWARLLFSGQASPPRQAQDAEEMLELVRTNRGAIGYVDRDKVDHRVRIVFEAGP